MSPTKPASSRAIAVVTFGSGLPAAIKRRNDSSPQHDEEVHREVAALERLGASRQVLHGPERLRAPDLLGRQPRKGLRLAQIGVGRVGRAATVFAEAASAAPTSTTAAGRMSKSSMSVTPIRGRGASPRRA